MPQRHREWRPSQARAPRRLRLAVQAVVLVALVSAGVAGAAGGGLDPTFGSGGKVLTDFRPLSTDYAYAVAIQPTGGTVAAGFSDAAGSSDFALARYKDGDLDASFGSGGKVLTDFGTSSTDQALAVAIQPNGKIIAAGWSTAPAHYDFALARYNVDGRLDTSFGSDGKVLTNFGAASTYQVALAIAIQPNGKIVVAGHSDAAVARIADFALARYTADGRLDPSFGSGGRGLTDCGGIDGATGVAIQPNGRILAAGYSATGGLYDFALARYTEHGMLDSSFDSLIPVPVSVVFSCRPICVELAAIVRTLSM